MHPAHGNPAHQADPARAPPASFRRVPHPASNDPKVLIVVQSFETVFKQNHSHREAKSSAPDGGTCRPDTAGLLKRYPVTATTFHLIGK